MIIRKAFKFQLKTKPLQEAKMKRFAGCCRKVWNLGLELQKKRLDNKEYCLNYSKLATELKNWKNDPKLQFLNEAHSQILQQTLMNLDRAIKDAFDKTNPKRFPQFKKKGQHDSFRYPQGFKINEKQSQIYLPKMGWIGYRNSRAVEGTLKNITVSFHGGKWYASIQTEQEKENIIHQSPSMVGIDLGVANFATLSNDKIYPSIYSFRRIEKKLARNQRSLSRKIKFSQNWHKQKFKISSLHIKVANIRRDFLHKTSTDISKNHAIIVLEDLKVSNMSQSASGTKETPGRQVKAKSGLNKSILDQGWSEFRRQLEYKQQWRSGEVIAIHPKNTSIKCSSCGHTQKENRKSQSVFCCVACNHKEHADINAAKNILAAGHAAIACGETVQQGRSMKQELNRKAVQAA